MKCNDDGLALIREFEGLSLAAYRCPAGVLTIGYGSTGPHVHAGMTITKDEAEKLLREDVERSEEVIDRAVKVPLNENQFSALASFVFNVGPGKRGVKSGFVELMGGGPSTMLRVLNKEDYAACADGFLAWTYAGPTKLKGLVTRRKAERALFLKPVVAVNNGRFLAR